MISSKTKYAIKALIELAEERRRGGSSLRIEEIAQRADAPKRFLEHILIDIRRSGIIASRRGRDGGYVLIKPPESVSIGEVLRMIDGPIAPLPCLSRKAYRPCDDCRDEAACRIRKVFGVITEITMTDTDVGTEVTFTVNRAHFDETFGSSIN